MNFMILLMTLLADVAVSHGTEGEVSTITTGAISAVVGAICTVLVMYFRTKAKVTVDGEVNVKETRQRKPEVSWTEVRDLKDRVSHMERKLDEMKISQGDQFQKLLTAAYEREHRLMEKIEKSIAPVHGRIDEMLRVMAEKKQIK
jgi:hypothetical protein